MNANQAGQSGQPGQPGRPDRVGTYFRQGARALTIVTVSGVVYNAGLAAVPYLEGLMVQCLLDVAACAAVLRDMVVLAALYLLAVAVVQGMRAVKRFYVRRFANDTARSMRGTLYNNIVHTSRGQLGDASAGALMTKAVSDVDAAVEGMRKVTTEIFDTGVAMVSYLVLLLALDWRLALLSCVFTPPAYWLAGYLKTRVYQANQLAKASAGRLSDATMDQVDNALLYRRHGLAAARRQDFETHLDDYERRATVAGIWESVMMPIYQAVSMAGVVLIVWLGARNVAGVGWAAWDIASFTAFLSCFARFATKASHCAKLFNAVQKAQVSWARIKPLLKPRIEWDEATELDLGAPRGLHMRDAGVAYAGEGSFALRGVSLDARPGQVVGVTGPVAGGKSTLGRLFLCEGPYEGSVRLGEAELRDLSAYELSQTVGYLGHDSELLSDTVRANVCLGEDVDVEAALRLVRLDEEVAAMPQGQDTLVGAGGVRLSGGQQARLALARTLARTRALYVLDDPFSAVDPATERQIMAGLRERAAGGVVVLISHRLTLFPQLDQVVWVEDGQARVSTHAELMGACSAYRDFYMKQAGGGDEAGDAGAQADGADRDGLPDRVGGPGQPSVQLGQPDATEKEEAPHGGR